MKSIILIAVALVAVAAAAPTEKEPPKIVSSSFVKNPDNSYSYSYVSEDGSSRQEEGIVKETLDKDNKLQKVIIVSGSYTYKDVEGIPQTITYVADEEGFRAEGKTIPKVTSRR